ncbi:MAG: ATP-binding protein [Vicinamibacterales bacterium]
MPVAPAPSQPLQTLENLNAIFSSVAEGIVMQSASGEIIECNASAERVLGLTRDQMMGRTSIDPRWRAIHEDGSDFPGSEHPAMVALKSNAPVRDVIMGVHKPDGTLSWICVNAIPIVEDGVTVRVVSTFTDVTARRTAEFEAECLRHENQESQRVLAAIGDLQASFIAQEELHLVFERILTDLLSLSGSRCGFVAEVVGHKTGTPSLKVQATTNRRWQAAIVEPGGDPAGHLLADLISRTIVNGEPVIANYPLPSPEGTPAGRSVESYLGLPLHVGSELVGMVGIANRPGGYDYVLTAHLSPYLATCSQILRVTQQQHERDRVERALAEQRERMSLVLEASGIGHWDWSPVTDEAVFDEQWTGMIGYAPSEIEGTGTQWLRLVHPDDAAATVDAVERHLRNETPEHRVEFRMRHRDGHWVWILAVGRVIERDAKGQATRMVGVHVDISARKAYETALAEATTEAVRASRAKSEFLANMSHEIRTPMNGVIGAANLLLFTELSDEQREYTDTIRNSGEILLALIDDILDISKIEAERLEVEHIPFDPRATIAEAIELEATRADSKKLELIVDWRSRPVSQMVGDPRRVQQVLLNLVSNAIKFTDRGHVLVAAEQSSPTELRISVTDTGIGIPRDKQKVIFETFMQADSSTTRRFGGSGLGLAISRRLVEAMGGTIGVCSVLGEGSTFWFTLPLGMIPPADAVVEEPLRDARVLVVDSSQTRAEAVSRLLQHYGAGATCVVDAAEAEAKCMHRGTATVPFDIVIVQYAPERFDVARFIRTIASDMNLTHASTLVTVQATRRKDALSAVAGTRAQVLRMPITRPGEFIGICTQAASEARTRRTRAAEDASERHPRVAPASPKQTLARRATQNLRVLLVEDDEVSRLVGQRMLQKHGCDVTLADDGRIALELTRDRTFDVLFMDCNMPGMDGFEASAAIRARQLDGTCATPPDVPIIALTANVLVGDRERCLAAGMVDYVAKPLLPDAVARVLARWSPNASDDASAVEPTA